MAMIFIQGRAVMVNNDTTNGIQWVPTLSQGQGWVIKAIITSPTPDSSNERSYVFVG